MNLGVVFTRGVSLNTWLQKGLLHREKLIYERFLDENLFEEIYWFTYGREDKELAEKLKDEGLLKEKIRIVTPPNFFLRNKFTILLYSFLMGWIVKNEFLKCSVLKSNQFDGSWALLIPKLFYGIKVVLRMGYDASHNAAKAERKIQYRLFIIAEKILFKAVDNIITTTSSHFDELSTKYLNVHLIPNYVDTTQFYSFNSFQSRTDRFLYVGRLSIEKNIINLVRSFNKDLYLDIIGDGPLKSKILDLKNKENLKIKLLGSMPNSELPNIYNSYRYYILPSFYENMPKSLVEAMCCGCLCFGTDVKGINELISHMDNGILANGTSHKLIEEMLYINMSLDTKIKISTKANTFALARFGIDKIIDEEYKVLSS